MLLSDAELEECWQAAASNVPIVIIGGGRWGRTWAVAASRARGSGAAITIVARTDHASARDWASRNYEFPGLVVVSSIAEALKQPESPMLAIIASRPSNHLRDGVEAINSGLDVLVEKPMCDRAQASSELLTLARQCKRELAIGTEYALLPAFHECARAFARDKVIIQKVRLYWDDPVQEIRHGGVKRHHEETNLLIDLLPHAHSIFRIFSNGSSLRFDTLNEGVLDQGYLLMRDVLDRSYELYCDRQAKSRRRLLQIETSLSAVSVNFTTDTPKISIGGVISKNIPTLHMPSTLRLTLGAFLLQRLQKFLVNPISRDIQQIICLQEEIERKLSVSRNP